MALTQSTTLNRIEIDKIGNVSISLLLTVNNGATVLSSLNHRTSLYPGCDITSMLGQVSSHLISNGNLGISDTDIASISSYTNLAWTPDIIASYQSIIANRLGPTGPTGPTL